LGTPVGSYTCQKARACGQEDALFQQILGNPGTTQEEGLTPHMMRNFPYSTENIKENKKARADGIKRDLSKLFLDPQF
jgi:hypothetical protein